jgi:uncharacterized membrane protein YphA (DoxX/SURF4 family)
MTIAVWIVQALVALAFGMAGLMKLTQPYDKLGKQMAWVNDFAPSTVRLIGALELLGAIGVIVPAATKILPWLTPVAALGLVLIMVGAMITHLRRHEAPMISINLVLLVLAAVVVIGRSVAVPV